MEQKLFEETKALLTASPKTPLATYRVQLHATFRFQDAEKIVPYLAALGISDFYTSPYFRAAPGSVHGYDVVDHTQLNPEIGSDDQHASLFAAVKAHGMGHLLDVVPNHMGIESGNKLWIDVLENGPLSIYAQYFDIDWRPVKEELHDKVLLPILGGQYGQVLERGELKLAYHEGAFSIRYFDHQFPISPAEYETVLSFGLDRLEPQMSGQGVADLDLVELKSIITSVRNLPSQLDAAGDALAERNREKEVIKRRLSALTSKNVQIADFLNGNLEHFNGTVGEPSSFNSLDSILQRCSYRLADWRVAGEEINYRRFFDINTLAAIRAEREEVFKESHARIFELIKSGKVTGIRIDHPDGLFDPTAYFLKLQEEYFLQNAQSIYSSRSADSGEWNVLEGDLRREFRKEFDENPSSPIFRALYVVVEKIQGGRERIPDAWAVHGTTGYRFANLTTGLLIDSSSEAALTETYHRFIGQKYDPKELLYRKKKLILSVSMSSEVNVLARELNRISEMNRRTRDFTLNTLRKVLVEFIAVFPVYRTYVDGWRGELDDRDIEYIHWTIIRAKGRDLNTNTSTFDFLSDILLRRYPEGLNEQERAVMLRFAMKLQQLTGPVMAKGLEDTSFYIYNRLVALNEVGGELEHFGTDLETFHTRNRERAKHWPASLLASSTHDTKRSEDVRARLTVISEIPKEWAAATRRWSRMNEKAKTSFEEGRLGPDSNDEYLYYQSVIGAWPMGKKWEGKDFEVFRQRIRDYMMKAVKEAKVNTNWTNPNVGYDQAVAAFVDKTLTPENARFLKDIRQFKERIELPGQINSLAQLVLKLASPGVPDIYQGTELWDLSLVDPDNRRPVDFELRRRLLLSLDERAQSDRPELCQQLVRTMESGEIKLFITAEGLRLRQRHPALFRLGDYTPLHSEGKHATRLVAFLRSLNQGHSSKPARVLTVVPRLVASLLSVQGALAGAFTGTRLLIPKYLIPGQAPFSRDIFSGQMLKLQGSADSDSFSLDVGELFKVFPVAVLEMSDHA